MRNLLLLSIFLAIAVFPIHSAAQKAGIRVRPRIPASSQPRETGVTAVVMDETLAVLRVKPSLFADAVQRMRRGRKVLILGEAEADGVKFFKVSAPPSNTGWVQTEAVFGKFRPGDEERLANFVRASSSFDQIELAAAFIEMYPDSRFKPSILLLFGDILEETALKLTHDAVSRLDRKEMAATAAPMHSYYLNFVSIDRYRKLGIRFLFNPATRAFHYDGQSWQELAAKYPQTNEAAEARKRLDSLAEKMKKPAESTASGNR